MAQIGVKVIIVPVEGRFQEARLMDMSHDLTLSGWATDSNDPDSFFRPLLSCAAIASQTNFAHWCNREFDDVLQKALLSQQLSLADGRLQRGAADPRPRTAGPAAGLVAAAAGLPL